MSGQRRSVPCVTVEEYLESEERSSVRREYVDGQLFAMSGVTRRHNLIAGNIHAALHGRLRGGPCRVYMSDVKVRVEATNSFYYPDVMVACDKFDHRSVYTTSPCLIFEVLSASTAAIDRREKLVAYRQLTSLKEYVLVHQRTTRVDIYRKSETGQWDLSELRAGDKLTLQSVPGAEIEIAVDDIYENVGPEEPNLHVREEVLHDYAEVGALEW